MATHNWPGAEPEFVEFATGSTIEDSLVAANRSQFDEEMDEPSNVTRIAPLRQRPIIPIGRRSTVRKLWLMVRDTWRWIAGPSALVRVKRGGRR